MAVPWGRLLLGAHASPIPTVPTAYVISGRGPVRPSCGTMTVPETMFGDPSAVVER